MAEADKIFRDKVKYLLKQEELLDKAVSGVQARLYELILEEYLPLFDTQAGAILNTAKNLSLINSIDNVFARLDKNLEKDVLSLFAKSLLESASMSSEYYIGLGFKKSVVSDIFKNKLLLEERLGLTPKGKLRKGGYLYRLGQTSSARQQLKDYVLANLTGDVSYSDFQLGFRNLVKGNKRVKGVSTTGVLQRYFDQFAYDKFSEFDAVVNKQFATNLNLKHLVYEGDLIRTSRAFCKKRAGKAFKVSDTKDWKNDPDLIDKKTKDTYRPLIERGRYRCRHFLKYVTEDVYNSLK